MCVKKKETEKSFTHYEGLRLFFGVRKAEENFCEEIPSENGSKYLPFQFVYSIKFSACF